MLRERGVRTVFTPQGGCDERLDGWTDGIIPQAGEKQQATVCDADELSAAAFFDVFGDN